MQGHILFAKQPKASSKALSRDNMSIMESKFIDKISFVVFLFLVSEMKITWALVDAIKRER